MSICAGDVSVRMTTFIPFVTQWVPVAIVPAAARLGIVTIVAAEVDAAPGVLCAFVAVGGVRAALVGPVVASPAFVGTIASSSSIRRRILTPIVSPLASPIAELRELRLRRLVVRIILTLEGLCRISIALWGGRLTGVTFELLGPTLFEALLFSSPGPLVPDMCANAPLL